MRRAAAPAAGWYPDPEHRQRLRWWDGLDWTDIKRAPPSDAELLKAEELFVEHDEASMPETVGAGVRGASQFTNAARSRRDTTALVEEVRAAARQEVDRAAQQFSDRATTAVRSVSPLISEYGNQVKRWVRRAVILSVVLLALYFILQTIGQAAILDWIGDRIDNVTEDSLGFSEASRASGDAHRSVSEVLR